MHLAAKFLYILILQPNRAMLRSNPTQAADITVESGREKAAAFLFTGYPSADKPQGYGDRVPVIASNPSSYKSVLKIYCKLHICQSPVSHRHCPLFRDFGRTHIDDLADGIIRRKY